MTMQEETLKRLEVAFNSNIRISHICKISGVARWKLNGLTSKKAKAYKTGTALTDEECADVCRALDIIKGAL